MQDYRSVKINKGTNGWGKYIIVKPSEGKDKVISVTGGGIHPLASRIAELSGGIAVDGFKNPVPNEQVFCAVVDCGGTLRTGLYPKQGIPTVNILDGGPSGPMAEFCKETNFVSGSKVKDIELTDEEGTAVAAAPVEKTEQTGKQEPDSNNGKGIIAVLTRVMGGIGRAIGKFINMFFGGARQAVNMMITNVIPFMAFIAFMIGLMTSTGFGNFVANLLTPFTNNIGGMILFALIIGIPVLSPLLAPGAAIQSVLGTLIGTLISTGAVNVSLALPALFAISVVDTCDFIPVAAALGEAEPDTSRIAVPAMLFSRFITAPVAVLVGYVAAIGLF